MRQGPRPLDSRPQAEPRGLRLVRLEPRVGKAAFRLSAEAHSSNGGAGAALAGAQAPGEPLAELLLRSRPVAPVAPVHPVGAPLLSRQAPSLSQGEAERHQAGGLAEADGPAAEAPRNARCRRPNSPKWPSKVGEGSVEGELLATLPKPPMAPHARPECAPSETYGLHGHGDRAEVCRVLPRTPLPNSAAPFLCLQ